MAVMSKLRKTPQWMVSGKMTPAAVVFAQREARRISQVERFRAIQAIMEPDLVFGIMESSTPKML